MFVLQQGNLHVHERGRFILMFLSSFNLHQMLYPAHGMQHRPHSSKSLIDGCGTGRRAEQLISGWCDLSLTERAAEPPLFYSLPARCHCNWARSAHRSCEGVWSQGNRLTAWELQGITAYRRLILECEWGTGERARPQVELVSCLYVGHCVRVWLKWYLGAFINTSAIFRQHLDGAAPAATWAAALLSLLRDEAELRQLQ